MYKRLMVSGIAAFVFIFTPVQAQTAFVQDKVAQVEAEGYKVSSIKRSWLGRIVITAKNNTELREIVLNRTSGDVLRDQKYPHEDTENRTSNSTQTNEPPFASPSGPGKGGGRDAPGGGGKEGSGGNESSGDGGGAGDNDSGSSGGGNSGGSGGGKGGPGGGKKGG